MTIPVGKIGVETDEQQDLNDAIVRCEPDAYIGAENPSYNIDKDEHGGFGDIFILHGVVPEHDPKYGEVEHGHTGQLFEVRVLRPRRKHSLKEPEESMAQPDIILRVEDHQQHSEVFGLEAKEPVFGVQIRQKARKSAYFMAIL